MSIVSGSKAWQYFTKDKNGKAATCKKCKVKIMCKGFSTSGLLRHLKNVHKELDSKRPHEDAELETGNVQRKITTFINQQTIEEIVSKLATVDGFSINAITKSEFIRKSLSDKGMVLPKNPSHVMNMIKNQYDLAKQSVILEITKQISSGSRFSISMDEYTSIKSRRYLNLNLHLTTKFWNLGMIPIIGSLPAEKIVDLIENKLSDFNLSMKTHIIASVTDGASVMKKFGRLSSIEHQLCYAHGLHLAVCDVLYKKSTPSEAAGIESDDLQFQDYDEEDSEDNEYDDVIAFDQFGQIDSSYSSTGVNFTDHLQNNVNISQLIQKVRKVVRMFRKSPLKNEILQKYVKVNFHKELKLILDVQTRWNSLVAMLERFLELKTCILKAMIDLKEFLDITDEEYAVMNAIITSLQPIKIGIERLGRSNATLLDAEGVFIFILEN